MCKTASEEWLSLFTNEMEDIWNTESSDIRLFLITYKILQKELKKMEVGIEEKFKLYKHKRSISETADETKNNENIPPSSPIKEDSIDLTKLSQSPVLNIRKVRCCTPKSPSLLSNAKKNLFSGIDTSVEPKNNTKLVIPILSPDATFCPVNTEEVIDSSIVENNSSNVFITKKRKLHKKENSACSKSNGSVKYLQLSGNKLVVTENIEPKDNKNSSKLKKVSQSNVNKISTKKPVSPEYPFITETVRGNARKNLPGWSCQECKKYYEGCNLTVEELKKKMDLCSKHRNKFEPQDDTPKGFWDVSIYGTQND
ncbi:hypothetical protein FQA39_LY01271 [Lamprigera yunnana]|nr:hypothetical protein FQA39_LY01271 [Lamprigera yunnana]